MARSSRISEADFDAFPPVVQRKFFSTYERLQLSKDGYCPVHTSRQERKLQRVHHASTRHPPHNTSFFLDREPSVSTRSRAKLRRQRPATASQEPPPFDSTDVTFFDSLPPSLQSKLFSQEEQVLLASNRGSVIVDAADEVLYRRRHQTHISQAFLRSYKSLPLFKDSDSVTETMTNSNTRMDQSVFDGFRWLETPDEELDLSLDDYHAALTQTTSDAQKPKRKPSFRRNMSLSTITFSRRNSNSDKNTMSASTRHSSLSSSQVRPISNLFVPHKHRSQSSVSSLGPSAEYYQNPEARLKLRVYLASPQKFDEAIEFGFPSLEEKPLKERETAHYARPKTSPRLTQDSGRTFFTDDTPSLSEGDDDDKDDLDNPDTPQDAEFRRFSKKSSSERTGITRPQLRIEPYAVASTNSREMTLHMTLTRPDLRSTDETKPAKKVNELPLEQEALPCDDVPHSIWDTLPEDSSVVKKLWRRLRSM